MDTNPQIELAKRYVMETGVSLFLTGKAGTGKTTFLHYIVENCNKRNVVLAPTGVAAVNAGGVTIHSFFQLPFCPYLPDVPELVTEYQMPQEKQKLRKSKIDIIRTLDLLIIDEISMVRADLLDAMDAVLRRYRHSSRPFGGVQLLMIGDVQQLSPVVTDEERPYMERVYPSPFFFHSKALQRMSYTSIQLTTIYRQQAPAFVGILNKIRDNNLDDEAIELLNTRVKHPEERQRKGLFAKLRKAEQEPILLTTHNHQADQVNLQRMKELKGESMTFPAAIEGNFPASAYPTDTLLELKKGAQVMFLKNDSSGARRYYNGKIGTVDDFRKETNEQGGEEDVIVVIDEEGESIMVRPDTWENIKYEIDPSDNQIKQIIDGTFTQYPLRTAWAITIHKAQGLTFDRVQVDASAAFTYGQVYVALSRCRTLEGLSLLAPIGRHNLFGSRDIEQFNGTLTPPDVAEQNLQAYRTQYFYDVLFELFDFSALQHDTEQLERLFQEHLRSTYPQQAAQLTQLTGQDIASIVSVAERFRRQLGSIGQGSPEDAKPLMAERIGKAAAYFLEQLRHVDGIVKPMLRVEVDSSDTAHRLKEAAGHYSNSIGLKQKLLTIVEKKGFDIQSYQKAKVDFALEEPKKESPKKSEEVYADVSNPKLVPILTKWRRTLAREQQMPAYTIITQKSLLAIADTLPRDRKALLKIPCLGASKVTKYGADIIQIVEDYCDEQEAKKHPIWETAARRYAEGASIADISGELLRAPSTVEGYILTAVENGILDPDLVLSGEEQDEIITFLLEAGQKATLKSVFEHFDGRYSYLKLRVARHLTNDL